MALKGNKNRIAEEGTEKFSAIIEVEPITSAGPALCRAFRTYARSLRSVARLIILLYVPLEVFLIIFSITLKGLPPRQAMWIISGARLFTYTLSSALLAPTLIHIYRDIRSGKDVRSQSALDALSFGRRFWMRSLLYRVQTGIYVLLGTLCLVLPGLLLFVMGMLVDPVVVLEPEERAVWARSRDLTDGIRMTAGASMAVVVALQAIVSLVLMIVLYRMVEAITGVNVAAAASQAQKVMTSPGSVTFWLAAATNFIVQIAQQLLGALNVALTFELYLAARLPRSSVGQTKSAWLGWRAWALK